MAKRPCTTQVDRPGIALVINEFSDSSFTLYNYQMEPISSVELNSPYMSIQTLPNGQWHLSNSSDNIYTVIDVNLEQHDESAICAQYGFSRCVIACDETDKVLLVLVTNQQRHVYNQLTPGVQVYYG
ncbi:unnamed protein product [Rotaria magnacalcarata]